MKMIIHFPKIKDFALVEMYCLQVLIPLQLQ